MNILATSFSREKLLLMVKMENASDTCTINSESIKASKNTWSYSEEFSNMF